MQNMFESTWQMNEECKEILDAAKHLAKLLGGEKKQALLRELSIVDRKLTDIYHYIEFSHFGVVEGYKAYKMLREILQERRKIKMQIEIRDKVCQFNLGSKSMRKFLSSCEEGVINKVYTPREMPELFEKEVPCSLSPCSSESEIISNTNASSAMQ